VSSTMDRIREATAKAAAGPLAGDRERPQFERVAAQSPFPPEAGMDDYVARFKAEVEALSAYAYGPFDADGVADQVVALINRSLTPGPRPSSVLSWDEAEIGCQPLGDRLEKASIRLVPGDIPNNPEHQTVLERLAEIEVGLTGTTAGLADTGSIVVASGLGRARIASLLPPVHIAILRLSRMYPTMQDWLAAGGATLAEDTANLVVITGGSRTSDIELQLTLGMHGPKELHVVLYRD
jgi:L-lactate dehydrogenase complex protein LldG